jgi:hypothetical protein
VVQVVEEMVELVQDQIQVNLREQVEQLTQEAVVDLQEIL